MSRHKIPPEPVPILLTDDGGYGVLAAVRALRTAGYAPWLAVNRPGTYAARSRSTAGTISVPDPDLYPEEFVRELAAARLSVAAVLPSAETHFLALAGRHADFPPGVALGAPSREGLERATDKGLLPKLAAAAGLQTPSTVKVVRGADERVGTLFGFPAIVKPLRSRVRNPDGTLSAYSPRYVTSEREVEEALKALPYGEGLIQPYIPGQLASVSGVSWEGELVCALHQVSVRIWPMPAGVSSYAETVPPNPGLERGVGRLLRAIGWSGLFQVQFVRTPPGEYYLIDLNPRIYGSLALAVAAGLNLPGIWVDLLLGRRPGISGYRVGTRFRMEEKDARTLVRMLIGGGGRYRWRTLGGFVPRPHTTHAIFSLRDPMPLLTSATKLAGWLAAEWLGC